MNENIQVFLTGLNIVWLIIITLHVYKTYINLAARLRYINDGMRRIYYLMELLRRSNEK